MNPETVAQLIVALAALLGQMTPLFTQLVAALQAGDDAQVQDLLRRLQAVNDQLGQAP